ncbi:MAG TPA: CoA transferase, partial [Candidatus Binatia bacterium]|nr:CoA transferase [Candidatus Binatia bacterium]
MSDNQPPAPNSQSPGPLHGIRVVECGRMVAAAYAAKLMADLGAEVVKVEEPAGDPARRRGPYPGQAPHPERSGLFLYLNTNKLGVTLNLQTAMGQDLLQRLLRD